MRKSGFWTLGIAVLILCPQPVRAEYLSPLLDSSSTPVDFSHVFGSSPRAVSVLFPDLSDSSLAHVLSDPENRVPQEFDPPAGMESAVAFWLKVYTQWTTYHVVIFDEIHPEVVYEVLDFRDLAQTSKNLIVYEILRERAINKKIAAYKTAFARLTKTKNPKSVEEKTILAAIKKIPHRHSITEFANNMRTQTGQRDSVIRGLTLADPFFLKMETIFESVGIPKQLTRLSLVESSFNPSAVSRVGAAGVWQFMLNSGLEYMMIDESNKIDERLSPLKSTLAAAKLLKRNKRILGNWPMAITAYNSGTRGLKKVTTLAMRSCKGRTRLGWAGRNYYPEFLAMLYAETYRDVTYQMARPKDDNGIHFERATGKQSLTQIGLKRGIGLARLKALNPDVSRFDKPLPRGFLIALPNITDDFVSLVSLRQQNVDHPTRRINKL